MLLNRVLILPDGRTESAPTVLLEALAAGCPIVATAVGGVTELVGDAGFIVPPDEPAALAAALRRILFEPGVAPLLGQKARARSAAYDWAAIAPRILGPQLAGAAGLLKSTFGAVEIDFSFSTVKLAFSL